MLEGILHGLLGNFVKGDAANLLLLFGAGAQLDGQVIGNGFAFAVRVRREKYFVGLGRGLLQLRNNFFLARRHDQRRLEGAMLKLHADVVFGQVHNVPDRSQHLEALAQIFFNRLRLGRRLDDNQ